MRQCVGCNIHRPHHQRARHSLQLYLQAVVPWHACTCMLFGNVIIHAPLHCSPIVLVQPLASYMMSSQELLARAMAAYGAMLLLP